MVQPRTASALTAVVLTLLTTASATTSAIAATADAPATATVVADWDKRTLTYRAAAGQANDLQVMDMPGGTETRRVAFNDEVPIQAGEPCTQPDPNDATRVVCELPADSPLLDDIRILLGDGDDGMFTDAPGVRLVDGGAGSDELHAHSAQVVLGGGGDDMLMGRVVMDGGDGMDHLMGDDGRQYLSGGRGDDHIEAYGGDDAVYAGSGEDHVSGGQGGDVILGGHDDDVLAGDEGADVLHGNHGDDTLHGGEGADRLVGGPGRDEVTQ
ncbi:calcium-binding protein [Allostreptomyces psammosilenae]|uniref:Ca2+-binding RTX toxin-like protein n=1 Tax=Allostreptomyces psammosilenae TaxID=1892865 RepID=A0A852ZS28_9ACTN|nr:calcium-binding protein [Allostreptomyces psammosilenae]NYI04615.1 Ca2+-binding RTX toxin-like protein [Allostreptomyces psammosilenae]